MSRIAASAACVPFAIAPAAAQHAATTSFDFASELAELRPDRGTSGTGMFDEDARVDLRSRIVTLSAFATNTWSLTTKMAITASARFNQTRVRLRDQIGVALNGDHSFSRLNPAAGMTYQARPWLNLFASYSEMRSRTPGSSARARPGACGWDWSFGFRVLQQTWDEALASFERRPLVPS